MRSDDKKIKKEVAGLLYSPTLPERKKNLEWTLVLKSPVR